MENRKENEKKVKTERTKRKIPHTCSLEHAFLFLLHASHGCLFCVRADEDTLITIVMLQWNVPNWSVDLCVLIFSISVICLVRLVQASAGNCVALSRTNCFFLFCEYDKGIEKQTVIPSFSEIGESDLVWYSVVRPFSRLVAIFGLGLAFGIMRITERRV